MDSSKVSEYSSLRELVSGRTASQKTEVMTIEQELSSKRQRFSRNENIIHSCREELIAIDKQIFDYNDRLDKLQTAVSNSEVEQVRLLLAEFLDCPESFM